MTKPQILIISSILVLPFNLFVFGTASTNYGAGIVFLLGCIFYWLYILLTVLLLKKDDFLNFSKMLSSNHAFQYARLLKTAAFLPAIGAFFVGFLPNFGHITLKIGLIILGVSVINGTIEEIYWRGLYLKVFRQNRYFILIVSPLLFALMHGSFLAIEGIIYEGGALALVGGALFMGLLWSYVSFRSDRIDYCIAGHVFVNIFAFTGLFVENNIRFF
jgi:hypothetical protein